MTLPEGFSASSTDAAVAEATTEAATEETAEETAEEVTETTTEATSTDYPTEHVNTSYPVATGTGEPDRATNVTMFTGAAAQPQQVLGGLLVGAVLALAGSLL